MTTSSYLQIREFQGAHRKLLREYIAAIDLAASLPFFVNIVRLLAPNEKQDTYALFNQRFFLLFVPLTWKPFVCLLVDMHIKAKMGKLSIAYNQLALRLPGGKKNLMLSGPRLNRRWQNVIS